MTEIIFSSFKWCEEQDQVMQLTYEHYVEVILNQSSVKSSLFDSGKKECKIGKLSLQKKQ